MEFIDGVRVTDTYELSGFDLDKTIVADTLVEVGFKQIFEHRFFHGDPHPGNILVLEDGTISFIDFGLMGRLTTKQHQTIIGLTNCLCSKMDARSLTRIMTKFIPNEVTINHEVLEDEISELLDKYYDQSLDDINVGEALNDILGFIFAYQLTLRPNIYLLIKSVISYEGIGLKLNPSFELAPHAQLIAKSIIAQRMSPDKLAKRLF